MSQSATVPAERAGACKFDVVQAGGQFPRGFESMPFTPGYRSAAVRIGGGCAKIDPKIVPLLPDYFVKSFVGANCSVISGGTIKFKLRKRDRASGQSVYVPEGFTVTYVPALLKRHYDVLAASTTPRVDQITLDKQFGGLILTDSLDRIDHRQDHAIIVQHGATEVVEQDWARDVLPFFGVMSAWKEKGVPCAWVGCEGGGVTKKELYWALEHGIPVILLEGSGRETDVFINLFKAGDAKIRDRKTGDDVAVDPALVSIVPFLDDVALNKALIARGIIAPAA